MWLRKAQGTVPMATQIMSSASRCRTGACARGPTPGHIQVLRLPQTYISKKGFATFNLHEFEDMMAWKRLFLGGCGVNYIPSHGLWDKWQDFYS